LRGHHPVLYTGRFLSLAKDLSMHLASLPPTLAIFGLPQGAELIVILFVGLLLFGRRLPEVGRSLGQGIVNFKKGLRDVEEDVENASKEPRQTPRQITDQPQQDPLRRTETERSTPRTDP
jgi:sec-independent protein translocase protein TatA